MHDNIIFRYGQCRGRPPDLRRSREGPVLERCSSLIKDFEQPECQNRHGPHQTKRRRGDPHGFVDKILPMPDGLMKTGSVMPLYIRSHRAHLFLEYLSRAWVSRTCSLSINDIRNRDNDRSNSHTPSGANHRPGELCLFQSKGLGDRTAMTMHLQHPQSFTINDCKYRFNN
jgi:hypothetical protein